MRSTLLLSLAIGLLTTAGCEKGGGDSAAAGETGGAAETRSTTDDASSGCQEVTVDFDGEDPPSIGTTWTLFPRCDGAVVMGAVVIRVEPSSAASLDENLITFVEAGICEITIQVGSQIGSLEVEVME